ncbi:dTDP-4-amino-4,6-dideoxyglucose formyltransferase [Croceibacter atlanticus]|uniref:dTDP-4-amino-4,6-dideoxyglucose formyltransferase n=1 Tax=Croceibacter atlanticus TaxID=313588 RepID=UPI0024B958EB|nr:dTDP-4-amino-4,6-dideoxyglucose formyltransferase [Croceibacter atlanticus]
MFKNVLVISDNTYICKSMMMILSEANLKNTNFTFSISPFSSPKDFDEFSLEPVKVFDLRLESDINKIIANFDLILSVHCKQIFPPRLVNTIKCINIHPGYNPINRGWYPQVFSIINDLPIGATIHEIDEEIDHGAIITRAFVDKKSTDTSLSLYNKIVEKELLLFKKNIKSIINNTYTTIKPESEGDLYLKKDFNALCRLDLEETLTAKQFIDKLRALTHGAYKNAFFLDPNSGKKIFISINLEEE